MHLGMDRNADGRVDIEVRKEVRSGNDTIKYHT